MAKRLTQKQLRHLIECVIQEAPEKSRTHEIAGKLEDSINACLVILGLLDESTLTQSMELDSRVEHVVREALSKLERAHQLMGLS